MAGLPKRVIYCSELLPGCCDWAAALGCQREIADAAHNGDGVSGISEQAGYNQRVDKNNRSAG